MVFQSIRDRLTGILAFFILGILVIPFAFVGVNSYFQTGTENLVALVNDQEITFTDFNQSYLNFRRRMQAQLGAAYNPADYDSLIARREHLDNMINESLLASAADSMGLDVDDDRLAEEIRNIPAFQVDGVFNSDVYQARLLAQGLTPTQFENDMRSSIILSQLPGSLRDSSFATDRELQEYIALQNQTRTFRAVLVAADLEAVSGDFDEADINAYYEAHQADFQTEERVVIEYLELSADTMYSGEEPNDDFLRERFEAQKGRFMSPERRLVSHVLVEVLGDADEATRETARQDAADVAERARAGEDFAALATELSDDAGSAPLGGDLGWVDPGVMVEAFENAMYELTLESPISEPVQTGFGWHVIQLREIEASEGMDFDEARQTLLDEYFEEEAEREFLDLADRMVDIIYEDPTTLEAAALDMGLEIQIAGPFSRAGGEGIAANPEVINESFSDLVLLQGSVSDPVDLAQNHMIMIRVAEHFPVAVKPVEEVGAEIIAALHLERADEAALARAGELQSELQTEGATLESVAEQAGLEVSAQEAAPRRHQEPDAELVNNLFKLGAPAEGESVNAVLAASNGHALVVLDEVIDGSLEEGAVLLETQYRRILANANASTESWALVRQLREESNVQVFEDNLGVSR